MRRLFLLSALMISIAACHKSSGPRRCYADSDCSGDRVCVELASSAQTCVELCDPTVEVVCVGGQACAPLDGSETGAAICLPGGDTKDGDSCATSSECERGSLCLLRSGQLEQRCEELCSLSDPDACGETTACMPVDDDASSDRGSCVVF